VLIVRALDKEKVKSTCEEKKLKPAIIKNYYSLSTIITGIVGTADEIYQYLLHNRFFTFYDIFLNILGGILGFLIFWAIKKCKVCLLSS